MNVEICPYCEAEIEYGEEYCHNCGAFISFLWEEVGLDLWGLA